MEGVGLSLHLYPSPHTCLDGKRLEFSEELCSHLGTKISSWIFKATWHIGCIVLENLTPPEHLALYTLRLKVWVALGHKGGALIPSYSAALMCYPSHNLAQ